MLVVWFEVAVASSGSKAALMSMSELRLALRVSVVVALGGEVAVLTWRSPRLPLIDDEEARALQREVRGEARAGERAVVEDALHRLHPGAHADLPVVADQRRRELILEGAAATLEADGVRVGDVVADDRQIFAVRLEARGAAVEGSEEAHWKDVLVSVGWAAGTASSTRITSARDTGRPPIIRRGTPFS
jgi:hypothetical protein